MVDCKSCFEKNFCMEKLLQSVVLFIKLDE